MVFGFGASDRAKRGVAWAERAIGSCECEFVVACLCLDGGGLSRHPFVNSAQRSSAVPVNDGTQSGFYDSLADGGAFSSG